MVGKNSMRKTEEWRGEKSGEADWAIKRSSRGGLHAHAMSLGSTLKGPEMLT